MINIFNLFLFLYAFWGILAFASDSLTMSFIALGFFFSLIVSLIAWKLKMVRKKVNFLFLNLGFYKHFLSLFFVNFFYCVIFLVKTTFVKKDPENNCFFEMNFEKILTKSEMAIFIASISFIPGLCYVDCDKTVVTIYALDERFFRKDPLQKIYNNINQVDDDNLV